MLELSAAVQNVVHLRDVWRNTPAMDGAARKAAYAAYDRAAKALSDREHRELMDYGDRSKRGYCARGR